jgi:hypothetical protein
MKNVHYCGALSGGIAGCVIFAAHGALIIEPGKFTGLSPV